MRKHDGALVFNAQCACADDPGHMAEDEEERRRSVWARADRMRAERRKKIGENAQSRMERVLSMQQRQAAVLPAHSAAKYVISQVFGT